MAKNHSAAFAADPKFLARLARQGITNVDGEGSIEPAQPKPAVSTKNESAATKRARRVREANMDGRYDQLDYDLLSNSLSAYFPGALLLSLNLMLRMHDAQATALKATWVTRLKALKLERLTAFNSWCQNAHYPVLVEEIYITPESHLLDHESVAAACKPILDAFVVNGFLPDDNGRYIAQPLPYTEKGRESGLIIKFRPSPRPWGLIADDTIQQARHGLGLKK